MFYNITFQQDWWKLIKTDETEMSTFNDLMQIKRIKFKCLQFIPDEELQIQYKDNKDTSINLRFGDLFQMCPSSVGYNKKLLEWMRQAIVNVFPSTTSLATSRHHINSNELMHGLINLQSTINYSD